MFMGRLLIGFGYGHIVPEMNEAIVTKFEYFTLPPEIGDKMGSKLNQGQRIPNSSCFIVFASALVSSHLVWICRLSSGSEHAKRFYSLQNGNRYLRPARYGCLVHISGGRLRARLLWLLEDHRGDSCTGHCE